jgi:hypothetical protein
MIEASGVSSLNAACPYQVILIFDFSEAAKAVG